MADVADYAADMAALEEQLLALLSGRIAEVENHPQTVSTLRRFEQTAHENLTSLRTRLSTLGIADAKEPRLIPSLPAGDKLGATNHAVTRALHTCYTAFNHMALGYAILHAVAHRFYDSTGDANTADLAEANLRRYTTAAQQVNQLISDAVVAELDAAGNECRCRCPSCTLGICLCASHGTSTVNAAWRETTSAPIGPGIEVRTPRRDSPAARAGLRRGVRIISADGQQLPTDLDITILQAAVRAHEPGESIVLDVLDQNGDTSQVNVTRG
jgi:PDZ domain